MTHFCSYVSLNCKQYCGFIIVVLCFLGFNLVLSLEHLFKKLPKSYSDETYRLYKGAFTRLKQEVDEFTLTAIDSSTELFQGEALLKTLQNRISMIHKLDAEIEFLIDDDLTNELEQQMEFHISAGVTIARSSALIENYKKNVIDLRLSFQQTLLHRVLLHRVK